MPRIDPLQLLNCLNVLLTPNGGIKSEQEVARISSLMEKFSKKLVSKCVYLLILKASDVHLLSMFMASGGWNLIYSWLVHAIEAKNHPFLIELLEVIIICPVDIERLKSNPMPRQIKNLSKDSVDSRVKELASDIVKHWLAIVKGTSTVSAPGEMQPQVVASIQQDQTCETEKIKEEVVEVKSADVEDGHESGRMSSDGGVSAEEEGKDDTNYVKSTSPSSSSLDSDDSEGYVPNKKASKKKVKGQKVSSNKKDKTSRKSLDSEKPKMKSKLIEDKDSKKTVLKLKIEKEHKSKREKDEKSLEEKSKDKRKLREDKEREKFAKLKMEREKKELKLSKEKKDKSGEKNKEKDKDKEDKSKADISKLIPKPLDKLGRIPKLAKDSDKANSNSEEAKRKEESKKTEKLVKKDDATKTAIQRLKEEKEKESKKDPKKSPVPVPPKKPVSMSVEKRFASGEAKPKTVKAYNSKFRLTGLEQEITPKPPSRKGVPSSSNSVPTTTSTTSTTAAAVKRSPAKDPEIEPIEKKLKSPEQSGDEKSPIVNKIKKPFLQESDVFMNAMNVALESQKELLRKRKKPTAKTDDGSSPSVKSPADKDVKPAFKFYKDTLESSVDESMNESLIEGKLSPDDKIISEKDSGSAEEEVKPIVIKSAEGLKSALALFRTKKHPKKSVKWKTDDELEAVQFFEVDVSERTNVVKDFWALQLKERSIERESLLLVRKTENDKMTEKIAWRKPLLIDISPPSTVRGVNSQEKNIQYARERTVPPALYYSKSMIPDTPAEPDLEIHPVTIPPVIPLDDISGSQDSVNDFSAFKWPEPKQFPPDGSEYNAITTNFMAGVPPPMFPFPDGTFPPFTQPFFPGGPVGGPNSNWTPSGNSDQSGNQNPQGQTMQWMRPPFDTPPNMVPPPVGPGMMAPPPFGMMAPPFPLPGGPFPGAPNMFPPPAMTTPMNNGGNNTDNQSYSSGNNYNSSNSENKKWNSEERYHRKESWKNNYSSDRSRDKRGSNNWRGSGGNSRLCKFYQKKGFCNAPGCRFYHPDK